MVKTSIVSIGATIVSSNNGLSVFSKVSYVLNIVATELLDEHLNDLDHLGVVK